MLFGSFVLAIFLIFVFALGKLINVVKNARFTRAWAPLIPILQGKVTGDGGGAATSWLTGTYRGRPVRASMTPNRNQYQGETGHYYNYFDVALLDVPGSGSWSVEYRTGVWGLVQEGWHIEAKDAALKSRLERSDLLSLLTRFGAPTVRYEARSGALLYSEDVTPLWIPLPERFQQELELLLELAALNAEVNPPSAARL